LGQRARKNNTRPTGLVFMFAQQEASAWPVYQLTAWDMSLSGYVVEGDSDDEEFDLYPEK
jgi:hypothetical protein